jgi:hypothetical protein
LSNSLQNTTYVVWISMPPSGRIVSVPKIVLRKCPVFYETNIF